MVVCRSVAPLVPGEAAASAKVAVIEDEQEIEFGEESIKD